MAAQFIAAMRLIVVRRIAVYPQQAYDGWRGDADAVYIGLDGDALKEQAVNMARYLLEDAAHYVKHRKAPGVRTLCIID